MNEYLPLLIVGAIIGVYSLVFSVAYALEKNKRDTMGFDRNMSDREIIRRLLRYAKPHAGKFVLALFIMLLSIGYDVASPMLVGHIEETVKKTGFSLPYLFTVIAVYAGILIVSMVCTYLQAIILQKTGQKIRRHAGDGHEAQDDGYDHGHEDGKRPLDAEFLHKYLCYQYRGTAGCVRPGIPCFSGASAKPPAVTDRRNRCFN